MISHRIYRLPVAYCLASLILLIVAWPFIETLRAGELIEALILTMVLCSAVFAVSGHGKRLAIALVLVAPALLTRWASYYQPELVPPGIFYVAGMLFVGFIVQQLLVFIHRAPRVDSEVICAGVTIYLMLGLFWSLAYSLLDKLSPESFAFNTRPPAGGWMHGFDALYFSLTTLSTLGYGDIAPVSGAARMLASMEALVGMFYMSLLIARLVSLYPLNQSNQGADRR